MKRIILAVCILIGFSFMFSSCGVTNDATYAERIIGTWDVTSVYYLRDSATDEFQIGEYYWVVGEKLVVMHTNYDLAGNMFMVECNYYIDGRTLYLETDPTLGYEAYDITRLTNSSMILSGATSTLYMSRRN